ncbi:MAG TPA: redoxin family protein [Pseudomonadota bacterium]|nr:redoxin family protein [Pseudomonadota bacterium]
MTPTEPSRTEGDSAFLRVVSWIVIGLLVVLVANELRGMFQSPAQPAVSGELAPELSVPRIDAAAAPGERFVLSEQRGHPVLLDFWATWCGPCKESLPLVNEVHRRLGPKGLRTIAIEIEGAEQNAKRFAAALRLSMPLGSDSGAVASAYKVEQIPLTVLIDSEGRIRKVFRGVHSITELTKAIEAIGLPSSPSSSGQ